MSSLSVRLDAETAKQAKALRAKGVVLSVVVRNAIREAYVRETGRRGDSRLAVLQRVYAAHPLPEDSEVRTYDVSDARAARDAIRARLRRKSRK